MWLEFPAASRLPNEARSHLDERIPLQYWFGLVGSVCINSVLRSGLLPLRQ